ncbi:MAG: hypothetical protein DRQ55_16635 [Planctomycetota bacterium]|nr:MAG: hypothetical protein DRQ55_16635 [Planctomycetota bacterium]
MPRRHLLLAGSWGPERIPARPHRDDTDWYLPLHVRDEVGARERLAAQVAAGADVIVAPTWRTHRRALLPLGETRRAAAWTAAAVRVARDALEVGLERRAELLADAPADDSRRGRPTPLIAASLPALDDEPEAGTGRLMPHEAATERDYRDQAGVLTDAEPDLLLVESQRGEAEVRVAITEAAATGLPAWAAIQPSALAAADIEAWLEWSGQAGLERILLPSLAAAALAADGDLPWGAVPRDKDVIPDWLDAGAGVVACLDGASVAVMEPLRAAIDDYERTELETARAPARRWEDHVTHAAAIAPGGAAVWLGERSPAPLPDGFEWIVVDAAEAPHLPDDHYRLVVDAGHSPDLGRLLEGGGILACKDGSAPRGEVDLQLLTLDDKAGPALLIYRREG